MTRRGADPPAPSPTLGVDPCKDGIPGPRTGTNPRPQPLSTMEPTNPETDPSEAALAAFTSACYAQEAAARRYYGAVISTTCGDFRVFCQEQDADADLTDLVFKFVDTHETVIHTYRARAFVMGYGESRARHEYGREIGWDDGPDPCGDWWVLASFILERECSEIAYELEEEREEQEAAR